MWGMVVGVKGKMGNGFRGQREMGNGCRGQRGMVYLEHFISLIFYTLIGAGEI